MRFENQLIAFSFLFTLGVGIIKIHPLPPAFAIPLYIAGGVMFLLSIALRFLSGERVFIKWTGAALLCISAILLGGARTAQYTYIHPIDPKSSNHLKWFLDKDFSEKSTVVGTIVSTPDVFKDYTDIIFQPTRIIPDPDDPDKQYNINKGKIKLRIYDRPDMEGIYNELNTQEAYGYVLQLNNVSVLDPRPASNPGTLDYRRFLNNQGVYAVTYISFWDERNPPLEILKKTKGNVLTEWSLKLREEMLKVIKKTMPYPYSAFLGGVTLGLRGGLKGSRCLFEKNIQRDQDRRLVLDEFRISGTSHVLAVSGLHTTILAGLFYGMFLLFRIPKKIFAPMVVLCLIIFTIITGARPATVRACFMNSFLVLSLVYLKADFTTSGLLAIGLAAFTMLSWNPSLIFEASFALSFMAVISLILITPPTEAFFKKYMRFLYILPKPIVTFAAAQIAIQLGMMLPLSSAYFNKFSIAGPFANFIAIPLITAIVPMGILAGIIGLMPGIGTIIALFINATNFICVWFFLWVVHICSVLFPYPFIKEFTPGILVSYYVVLTLVILYPQLRIGFLHLYYKLFGFGTKSMRLKMTGLVVSFVIMIVAFLTMMLYEKPDNRLKVTFLDIGYGNAIHIETPRGYQVLIDAGRNGSLDRIKPYDVGERTVLPYLLSKRIAIIDYMIASNVNEEDITGLVKPLEVLPVDRFYSIMNPAKFNLKARSEQDFTRSFVNELGEKYLIGKQDKMYVQSRARITRKLFSNITHPWNFKRIIQIFSLSPLRFFKELLGLSPKNPEYIMPVSAGEMIHEEKGPDGKKLEIFFLHPEQDKWKKPLKNNAIVVKLKYGDNSFLFTGDIEKSVESTLLGFSKYLKSDVMSVPSHGSKFASSRRFIEAVSPRYAVCQFGRARYLPRMMTNKLKESIEFTEQFYKKMKIKFYRTDNTGAVTFYSDGKNIEVKTALKIPTLLEAEETRKEAVEF